MISLREISFNARWSIAASTSGAEAEPIRLGSMSWPPPGSPARPGSGSSRSPEGSGRSRGGGRRRAAGRSTSGSTSMASSTWPSGGPRTDPAGGEHLMDGGRPGRSSPGGPTRAASRCWWTTPGAVTSLRWLYAAACTWSFFWPPPCTPELQPAELLLLLREVVTNEWYDELGVMELVLLERCRWLIENPEGRPRGRRLRLGYRPQWLGRTD